MSKPRAALSILVVWVAWVPLSHAATFHVDTTTDDPQATACDDGIAADCSLRGAILAANAGPAEESSTIVLPAGTYVLSQPSSCTFRLRGAASEATLSQVPLCLTARISIEGAGADVVAIDGDQLGRVIFVDADAVVDIRGVTIRNGMGDRSFYSNPNGGGILNHGFLTLTEVVVSDSYNDPVATGAGGAGIYNQGFGSELTLVRSLVTRNGDEFHAGGGGISNQLAGVVTIVDSIISQNTIGSNGGGVFNYGGTVTIRGSTIADNLSKFGLGGGIANVGTGIDNVSYPGVLTVVNSTISRNTSGGSGGGVYNHVNTTVELNNVTIANNSGATASGAGGGFATREGAQILVRNTIIAGNTDGVGVSDDCDAFNTPVSAPLTSQGYNLIGNTTNCVLVGDTTGNILNQDPLLGPLSGSLSAVGSLTPAHPLLTGSPALDAGNGVDAPGSGGVSCAAVDQQGFVRPQNGVCDMGAIEGARPFALSSVVPQRAGDTGPVTLTIFGSGIDADATVELLRQGESAIVADPVVVAAGRDVAYATFDLAGAALGAWDVRVTNLDDTVAALNTPVTIEPGQPPQLWIDVVGHPTPRIGRLTRYFISLGNRSNVDALNVPLTLSVPFTDLSLRILAPPLVDGQVAIDWEEVPATLLPNTLDGGVRNLSLLLPVVPAGFVGVIEARLDLPLDLGGQSEFLIYASIGDPLSDPEPLPGPVADRVAAAQAYIQQTFDLEVSPTALDEMHTYAEAQLLGTVAEGRAGLAASAGGVVPLYSLSQLQIDLALFGFARMESEQPGVLSHRLGDHWLATVMEHASPLLAPFSPTSARAQQNCPKTGGVLAPGCSDNDPPFKMPPDIQTPPECDLSGIKTVSALLQKVQDVPNCALPPESCLELPNRAIVKGNSGKDYCVNEKCRNFNGVQLFGADNGICRPYPIRPINSRDPNDKHGTLGATDGHFLVRGVPLTYTIRFENMETATAPAQEVVVTDQLDAESLDLSTFRLGPMSFGDHTLTPAASVARYTGSVDLRPEQNLIVVIEAGVDEDTGVAQWRFTSTDPDTLQFPEDPIAGFLPPNVDEPEGEGSVVFTIEQKDALAPGTTVCNDASIVFDVNEPIVTNEWCNTIDQTPPTSAVEPLEPGQAMPQFPVQWAGNDADAGIAAYTVYVAEAGGAFTAWLQDTTKTSALFNGEPGVTYSFYSIALDNVGNIEDAPTEPDATTVARAGCSQPVTTGASPTASDCLFVLRTAVGSQTCEPSCVCDVNGDSGTTAVDALFCLKKAVGENLTLACDCPVVTTTTTTTLP